jgi:hypothetical protein
VGKVRVVRDCEVKECVGQGCIRGVKKEEIVGKVRGVRGVKREKGVGKVRAVRGCEVRGWIRMWER